VSSRLASALLAARVLLVAAAVPALMRLPLSRLERLLEPCRPRRASEQELARLAERVERVLSLGPPLVRSGCLTRGVTLYYFLRRAGADVALAFGIAGPDDDFVGHCWLVRGGRPFLEAADPAPRFTEVVRLGAAAPHAP